HRHDVDVVEHDDVLRMGREGHACRERGGDSREALQHHDAPVLVRCMLPRTPAGINMRPHRGARRPARMPHDGARRTAGTPPETYNSLISRSKTRWHGGCKRGRGLTLTASPAISSAPSGGFRQMESVLELSYALDTFYFLICGAFVMWMAAGFSMLESGLVRAKNTAEILTKNVGLYSIASIMYMLCGYGIMYGDGNGVIPGISMLAAGDNAVADVVAGGDDAPYYSSMADFFFQVVFVATAMSIVSGAVAERMKLWS